MKLFNIILLYFFLFFSSLVYSHNPEDFVISEIEQGKLTFENEKIATEYNSALKRLRIRRINAMHWSKKNIIFIKAGFEHILPKGLDHILFVLGLFFSCLKFSSLLLQVTAFTFAHSITLILASQGLIQIHGPLVEALIALSIVWIAIENCIFKKPNNWRPIVVFTFGLLHGLGFASVLSNYGLPKDNFISLLLAFNIGVEIGQLSVLIMAFILIKLTLNKSWKNKKLRIPVSILIGLVGLFWFSERIISLF